MRGSDSPSPPEGEPIVTVHSRIADVSDIDLRVLSADLSVAAVAACAGVQGVSARRVARVDLLIVGDAEMSRFHERYSGVLGTTDVLTFPASQSASSGDEPIEVDIVVCADEARRRARELGHNVDRELLLYGIHGVLHCLGYDDHDPDSYERMHAEEDRILTEMGKGRVFRPSVSDGVRGAGDVDDRTRSDA